MCIVRRVAPDTINHSTLTKSTANLLLTFASSKISLPTTLHSEQRQWVSFRVMVVGGEAQRFKRPFMEEQGLVKVIYFKSERPVFPYGGI